MVRYRTSSTHTRGKHATHLRFFEAPPVACRPAGCSLNCATSCEAACRGDERAAVTEASAPAAAAPARAAAAGLSALFAPAGASRTLRRAVLTSLCAFVEGWLIAGSRARFLAATLPGAAPAVTAVCTVPSKTCRALCLTVTATRRGAAARVAAFCRRPSLRRATRFAAADVLSGLAAVSGTVAARREQRRAVPAPGLRPLRAGAGASRLLRAAGRLAAVPAALSVSACRVGMSATRRSIRGGCAAVCAGPAGAASEPVSSACAARTCEAGSRDAAQGSPPDARPRGGPSTRGRLPAASGNSKLRVQRMCARLPSCYPQCGSMRATSLPRLCSRSVPRLCAKSAIESCVHHAAGARHRVHLRHVKSVRTTRRWRSRAGAALPALNQLEAICIRALLRLPGAAAGGHGPPGFKRYHATGMA